MDEIVNKRIVKYWLWSSLAWVALFPGIGLLLSLQFHNPEILSQISLFSYGRLRPVHVNGVVFGAFSTAFIGLLYYLVPRLCGRPMVWEKWGWWQLVVWNAFLILGSLSLLLGLNSGYELAEFPGPTNLLRGIVILTLSAQVLTTILLRRERGLYVSLWYVMAGLMWFSITLILGNLILPYMPMSGINNVNLQGLYLHYIFGLWLVPAGLALVYFFLPLALHTPLFSHRLSLLGFWTLALFYPLTGTHHYIFSPIPYATQTIAIVASMALIIPVWAVSTNFFGTLVGQWKEIVGRVDSDAYAAKFLIMGAVFYLMGCLQGSLQSLRNMQELVQFTDFAVSHAHLTLIGSSLVWIFGALYYVWPRVTGRRLVSSAMASWHMWLTFAGLSVMFLGTATQGFMQGTMLKYGIAFLDTVREQVPWWIGRSVAGVTLYLGIVLMLINLRRSARRGERFEPAGVEVSESQLTDQPLRWVSRSSLTVLTGGLGLLALALIVQAVWPGMNPAISTPAVTSPVAGVSIKAQPYSDLEARGQHVYVREGCWYCHSQFIRPVAREWLRWGPLSQAGEYAYDQPALLGTRRVGPDLWRVGRKVSDDWHAAHIWDPRQVVPDSIMPAYPWLLQPAQGDAPPRLGDDGKALVAYLQRLGTGIGDWRAQFIPTQLAAGSSLHLSDSHRKVAQLPLGQTVYRRHCAGCHGVDGDGRGPAAPFLDPKPRDFTRGIFKFHSTPGKNALPTEEDLYLTITHGLWGTSMASWHMLSADEVLAVTDYLKTFSDRWQTAEHQSPIQIPIEPAVTRASLERGSQLYSRLCAQCHGAQGKGNGPRAADLQDIWGNPLRPADLTLAAGLPGGVKLGHDGEHLYTVLMTGIGGTPMQPLDEDALPRDQRWDLVHYVQFLRADAQMEELRAAGLAEDQALTALTNIWQTYSEAARRGLFEARLIQDYDG